MSKGLLLELFSASIVFSLLLFALPAHAACPRIASTSVIGIKASRQYLPARKVLIFSNAAAARARGYTPWSSCGASAARERLQVAGAACVQAAGIKQEKRYISLRKITVFRSKGAAWRNGYARYSACPPATPTAAPTPTIAATPLPSAPAFVLEGGIRHTDIRASSTIRLDNGNFRAYLAPWTGIAASISADGLTWSAPANLAAFGAPRANTWYTSPSAMLSGGQHLLIVQRVLHVGAIDFGSLMRSTSADGAAFSFSPESPVLGNDVVGLGNPDILALPGGTMRMYYDQGGMQIAISTDSGVTWTPEGAVTIAGNSSSLAPYPRAADIIALPAGGFRLFFDSPRSDQDFDRAIFSARSDDGLTFGIEEGPLLTPPAGTSYQHPDAVVLQDGRVRLYFSATTDGAGNILSAVTQ